jgi:hypothetical protein
MGSRTLFALSAAVILSGAAVLADEPAFRDDFPAMPAPEPHDGLRLSLALIEFEKDGGSPVFRVTFENVGDKDAMLNLGIMLGNGRILLPDAIRLVLTDTTGHTRELRFASKKHGVISGRVDDYALPLRVGSAYSLRLRLHNFWCPKEREVLIKLKPGAYQVGAEFTGTPAQRSLLNPAHMKHDPFWKGKLQSETIIFQMQAAPAGRDGRK